MVPHYDVLKLLCGSTTIGVSSYSNLILVAPLCTCVVNYTAEEQGCLCDAIVWWHTTTGCIELLQVVIDHCGVAAECNVTLLCSAAPRIE